MVDFLFSAEDIAFLFILAANGTTVLSVNFDGPKFLIAAERHMPKVFLSWSGSDSHSVAQALYEWLPVMLQSIKPFMSSEDLRKGGRWNIELATELESTSFGIICLTNSNLNAPWILFEAGALSKVVSESNVSPLLVDVRPSDLPAPLTQFNATKAEKDDFWKLLKSINSSNSEDSVKEDLLQRSFDSCWPSLEAALNAIKINEENNAVSAPTVESADQFESILQELLVLTRSHSQLLSGSLMSMSVDQLMEVVGDNRARGLPDTNHPAWRDISDKMSDVGDLIFELPPSPEAILIKQTFEELGFALGFIFRRLDGFDFKKKNRSGSRDNIMRRLSDARSRWSEVAGTTLSTKNADADGENNI